jgi:ABC-type dipeptide/oligopeptide/nickel transport system permease component
MTLNGTSAIEIFFAYKGLGALFLKVSLNQAMHLIKACTLVAIVRVLHRRGRTRSWLYAGD